MRLNPGIINFCHPVGYKLHKEETNYTVDYEHVEIFVETFDEYVVCLIRNILKFHEANLKMHIEAARYLVQVYI